MLVLLLGMKIEGSVNHVVIHLVVHMTLLVEKSGSKVIIDCCGLPVGLQASGFFMGSPNLTTYNPEV